MIKEEREREKRKKKKKKDCDKAKKCVNMTCVSELFFSGMMPYPKMTM